MADFIVVLIIVLLVMAAVLYIQKQRKQGVTCSGCPHAGTCAKKSQGGCK